MDIENPLREHGIPVAKLVCIEVIAQPMRESVTETYNNNNTINVEVSFNKCAYDVFKGCFSCVIGIVCCFGFLIFLTGYPFI